MEPKSTKNQLKFTIVGRSALRLLFPRLKELLRTIFSLFSVPANPHFEETFQRFEWFLQNQDNRFEITFEVIFDLSEAPKIKQRSTKKQKKDDLR